MAHQKNNPLCYFRLFNARPTKDAFDVYLDNERLYSYLLYEDFTKYYPLPSGKHVIKVTYHHQQDTLYEKKINLQRHQIYTGVLAHKYKEPDSYHIFCLEESKKKLEGEHLGLRLLHFSSFPDDLFLGLDDTPLPIRHIRFGQASSYLMRTAATYNLYVDHKSTQVHLNPDTPSPLATFTNQKLKPGRLYSLFFVGTGTAIFPYKVVLSIDGYSYLKLEFDNKNAL